MGCENFWWWLGSKCESRVLFATTKILNVNILYFGGARIVGVNLGCFVACRDLNMNPWYFCGSKGCKCNFVYLK